VRYARVMGATVAEGRRSDSFFARTRNHWTSPATRRSLGGFVIELLLASLYHCLYIASGTESRCHWRFVRQVWYSLADSAHCALVWEPLLYLPATRTAAAALTAPLLNPTSTIATKFGCDWRFEGAVMSHSCCCCSVSSALRITNNHHTIDCERVEVGINSNRSRNHLPQNKMF